MHEKEKQVIFSQVCDTIAAVSASERAKLSLETSLLEDLDLDSLALYEIVIDLETHYKLQISDEEIEVLRTIGEVVNFIAAQLDMKKEK